jgi:hypothetical protein
MGLSAGIIEARAREAMVAGGINTLLSFGILTATAGLIFWLADALAVAVLGALLLVGGLVTLAKAGPLYRLLGNAAALVGAGLLIGGSVVELLDKHEAIAGRIMALCGALVLIIAAWRFRTAHLTSVFVLGVIALMGLGVHLGGLGLELERIGQGGLIKSLYMLYAALLIAAAGWLVDVRFVTALAIVPFAQVLETGTSYFHAVYVFYSPEPTLSILQMGLLIGLALSIVMTRPERIARHAGILAVMGFIVANLCALVGSLWGDYLGETLWGPGYYDRDLFEDWSAFREARDAFRESALFISENAYTLLWAIALVAMILWAARRNMRGLFNAALTFGAIHAYTQLFESFADEPMAWALGGLGAIGLAWGAWRLNQHFPAKPV